ncbi:hypothetical protein L810_3372 [Burkholderia sp. AU4i]|nr:hypothetical protein L810_3372 [Burkholderia sp. AU4i]
MTTRAALVARSHRRCLSAAPIKNPARWPGFLFVQRALHGAFVRTATTTSSRRGASGP